MHINLIYKDEQRSASPVSLWLLARVVIGVVLFLLGFWIFTFAMGYRSIKNQADSLEREWGHTDSKYKAAMQVRNELLDRMDTLKALQGWKESRLAWGGQLDNLGGITPDVIQLNEVRVSHALVLVSNSIPARVFELKVSGRTAAARSEVNVIQFLDGFKREPFSQFVESAILPPGAFRQDPVMKSDRVFEIVCKYHPRLTE